MLSAYALIVLCASGLALANLDFVARNCDNSDNSDRVFDLISAKLKTDTIVVPGQVEAALKFEVKKAPIPGKKYDIVFDLSKKILIPYVTVPCDKDTGLGSCTFDFCDYLAKKAKQYSKGEDCPEAAIANGIPCSCDKMKPGVYDIPMYKFDFTKAMLPDTSLAYGDFKADVKILRHSTQEEVGCVHLEFTLSSGCTGIFCDVFGK